MVNFTEPTNFTRPGAWFEYLNSSGVTDGLAGSTTLLAIFIVAFISLKKFGNAEAFSASCFITTLLAILLRAIGGVTDVIMFSCIIITVISIAFLWFGNRNGG